MDVEALLRPVVESEGLELVEVTLGKEGSRRVLRVTVDREGGIDLDTISETAQKISRRLDLEGFEAGPYALEVSSPGIERPLRNPKDFRRKIGESVKVRTVEPATYAGRLAAAEEEGIVVETDDAEVRIAYDDISSARTVFEWGGKR
jgi:ribosome maturation factor RimP